jgi:transposase
MRIAAAIDLTATERKRLQQNVKSRTTPLRLIERSKILLLADEGVNNRMIASQLGITENKVGRWRNRYAEGGLKAIEKDRPRGKNHGGKKTASQARLRKKVIEMTTQETPDDATHWSTRSLAEKLNTTHSFVHRVWKSVGLKPHLIKTFKVSNDPQFEEKLHDVVGLYLDPPQNAVVLSIDEKSSIQALDRTQPGLPLKKGRCGTMTHDYKRHGTSTLFAALDIATGQVIGESFKQHRHQEFLQFLKKVERQTPKDQEIHIVLDNYATHKHPNILEWITKKKRIFLHFIPTSSSWLNMVERFFGILTEKRLRRGVFTSVKELEAALEDFIVQHNKNPKPFVWTKSTEEILEKVGRARETLNNLRAD